MAKNAKTIINNAKTHNKTDKSGEIDEKYYYSQEEDNVIVSDVLSDFNRRRNERKTYDLSWELNINFLIGNQYSSISSVRSSSSAFWASNCAIRFS